jgi:hypothetical protein
VKGDLFATEEVLTFTEGMRRFFGPQSYRENAPLGRLFGIVKLNDTISAAV